MNLPKHYTYPRKPAPRDFRRAFGCYTATWDPSRASAHDNAGCFYQVLGFQREDQTQTIPVSPAMLICRFIWRFGLLTLAIGQLRIMPAVTASDSPRTSSVPPADPDVSEEANREAETSNQPLEHPSDNDDSG